MEKILLANKNDLDIVKTFECGQCFRWNMADDGCYYGIVGRYPAKIWTEDEKVYILSDADEDFWNEYFDLLLNYREISEPFLSVPYLDECTRNGMGIRILKQDPWEALCSFIISQCNNIKRIKGIVEKLCSEFGEPIEFENNLFYTFPSADTVSKLDQKDLDCLRSGYRAPYIIGAAKAVSDGRIDLYELQTMDYKDAKKKLMELNGIGEKVANCVILFGLHHMEAFPIDVWIKRALKEHFPKDFSPESLGSYAGLAQQYIFYEMRE